MGQLQLALLGSHLGAREPQPTAVSNQTLQLTSPLQNPSIEERRDLQLRGAFLQTADMISPRFARPVLGAASRQLPRSVTRSYAAAASIDSKPPIPLFGVDSTYANALVSVLAASSIIQYERYYRSLPRIHTIGPSIYISLLARKWYIHPQGAYD